MDSITYTVVYTGSEIVPVKTHIWDNDSLAAPLLIIAAVLLCAGIAAVALILLPPDLMPEKAADQTG